MEATRKAASIHFMYLYEQVFLGEHRSDVLCQQVTAYQ